MSIQHHPSDALLSGFAAGALDLGQHIAVATHLNGCAHCANWVRALECAGGVFLADLPPAAMSRDAFTRVEARLNQPFDATETAPRALPEVFSDLKGLPAILNTYEVSPWKWLALRMYFAPIQLPEASETRVFLLRSGPGTKLLEHAHTEEEMTCVLRGGFSHEGGRFGPGDFDFGDAGINHRVLVEQNEDCVCLIAMKGSLRLEGTIGRLIEPLVRL
jgi:putative transcriptional regulator